MFHLIRLAIWIVGFVVVGSFLLDFFGYVIRWDYVQESKDRCFGLAVECQKTIERDGAEKARCPISCFEFSKLFEKRSEKNPTGAK